jgi:alanine racemase-like protein
MTFRLTIDVPAWDRSLHEYAARTPGLVPVIKGNGYGFGAALLAGRSSNLGVHTVAVGVTTEIAAVRAGFAGEILVMGPLQRYEIAALATETPDPNVLRTVAHRDVLRALADLPNPPRVVLELDSPVHRHGILPQELSDLVPALRRLSIDGLALHLPSGGDRWPAALAALRSVTRLRAAGVDVSTLWVSHLSSAEVTRLSQEDPSIRVRARVGTALWLGDRSNFVANGTVLDAHPAPRNEAIGYRQRRSPAGTIVVVSGGTAHGVGLQGSSPRGRWRDLARAAVAGAAHGAGLAPSPFRWSGRRLRYADVPHMQVSMLLVPAGVTPPEVGERLQCSVRMTVTTFDETEMLGVEPAPGTQSAADADSVPQSSSSPKTKPIPEVGSSNAQWRSGGLRTG